MPGPAAPASPAGGALYVSQQAKPAAGRRTLRAPEGAGALARSEMQYPARAQGGEAAAGGAGGGR